MKERLIEITAVVLNLLFTWLYAQGNPWCFVLGILSPLLYIYLTFHRKIYADSFLQVFYIVTTIWGYFRMGETWQLKAIEPNVHMMILAGVFVVTGMSGKWLKKNTNAALPSLDSFITCLAIAGTVLMMWPAHSCWLYLLAVNILSFILYANRKLYISCGMFAVYILMCIDSYWQLNLLF
jgi:nicotinamide mononucleotide transporter